MHTGWADPLLRESDTIVWIAGIRTRTARRRIVRRFVRDAWTEARRRRGRDKVLRFRDYAAQLRALVSHLSTFSADGSRDGAHDEIRDERAAQDVLGRTWTV